MVGRRSRRPSVFPDCVVGGRSRVCSERGSRVVGRAELARAASVSKHINDVRALMVMPVVLAVCVMTV